MSLASSTGLVSGLDYTSIISKLRQAGSGPIVLAQQAQSKIQSQSSALDSIQKVLADFKSKAEALNTESSFLSMTASTSDYSILNVSTTGKSSVEGNYGVLVKQLAQTHRIASQGVSTTTTTPIAMATASSVSKSAPAPRSRLTLPAA
jgi:flagellar hook-associated protein 2